MEAGLRVLVSAVRVITALRLLRRLPRSGWSWRLAPAATRSAGWGWPHIARALGRSRQAVLESIELASTAPRSVGPIGGDWPPRSPTPVRTALHRSLRRAPDPSIRRDVRKVEP